MLRRLKTDVETQLPDKVEIVFHSKMSIWQRVLYRQMSNRIGIAGSAGNGGSNFTVRSFNNVMMQLKKVCNHPFLFYQDDVAHVAAERLPHSSSRKVRTSESYTPQATLGQGIEL